MADIFRPFVTGWNRLHAVWTRARRASSSFDHAVRSYQHYDDARGNRLAAYMSYFGVLSLFPIIALAFAVAALLVAGNAMVGRGFDNLVESAVTSLLPGLQQGSGSTNLFDALQSGTAQRLGLRTGGFVTIIAGVVVLLYTGSGWISAQREAVRTIFGSGPKYDRFFLVAKAHDVLVLLVLGVLLVVSVSASTLAQALSPQLLDLLGLHNGGVVAVLAQVAVLVTGLVTGIALFLVQHHALAGVPGRRWRSYLPGAVVATIGFELLKQAAALLIQRIDGNAIYGTFAAIIAILVWINLTSRVTLLGAAWTVTGWESQAEAAATRRVLGATPTVATAAPTWAAGTPGPGGGPGVAGGPGPGGRLVVGMGSLAGIRRVDDEDAGPGGGREVAVHVEPGPARCPGAPTAVAASVLSVGLAVLTAVAALTGLARSRTRR